MDCRAIIRKMRHQKGHSQEYMADKLNISQKTYSNIENDKCPLTLTMLEKIAAVLEVSFLELLPQRLKMPDYDKN